MKIRYDRQVDALYIQFITDPGPVMTEEVGEGITMDMTEDGQIVGIEVLDARHRFGERNIFEQVVLEGMTPAA